MSVIMNFKNLFSKRAKTQSAMNNPYVEGNQGRQEWNDRYFNLSSQIKKWQIAFAVISIALLIQIGIVGKLATQSRVQPYAVETNHGQPIAIHPMPALSARDSLLINYALTQFIINTKTVVADKEAQKTLLNKAYAFSANNTIATLRDFYANNNPYDIAAQNHIVNVRIINVLPLSAHSAQISWEETQQEADTAHLIKTSRWLAQLTYRFDEVNEKFINDNPFGLYVTALTWSQSQ